MDSNRFWLLMILVAHSICVSGTLCAQQQITDGVPISSQNSTDSSGQSADQLYALATTSYTHQRWDDASKYFQLLVESHPSDSRSQLCWFYLGESLVQIQKYVEAKAAYDQYLTVADGPLADRATFRVGECLYLLGNDAAALTQFQEFLRLHPDNALAEFALPYLGELYLKNRDGRRAKDAYEQVIQAFPHSSLRAKCQLGLAQALILEEDLPVARQLLQQLADDPDNGLTAHAILALGKLEHQSGQWAEAESVLLRIEEFPVSNRVRYEAISLACDAMRQQKKWGEIVSRLNGMANTPPAEPWGPKLVFIYADALSALHQNANAAKYYRQVVQRWPNSEWAVHALSREIAAQPHETTIADLQTKIKQLRNLDATSEQLCSALQQLGQLQYSSAAYSDAASTFQELIRLAPQTTEAEKNRQIWSYLASLSWIGMGKYGWAAELLGEVPGVVQDSDLRSSIAFARATALSAQGEFEPSLVEYEKALELGPASQVVTRCLADYSLSLAQLDRLDEADEQLSKIDRQTENVSYLNACEVTAERALKSGNRELAVKYFQILSHSADADYSSRGKTGLIWAESNQSATQLSQLAGQVDDQDSAMTALLARAVEYQNAGDHENAVSLLRTVRNSRANQQTIDSATVRLGVSLLRLKDEAYSNEAIKLLNHFVRSVDSHTLLDLAKYELAWAYKDNGQIDDSIYWFESVIDMHSKSELLPDAYYRAAQLHREKGNTDNATMLYQALAELDDAGDLRAHARFALGEIAARNRQWQSARKQFQALLENNDPADKTMIDASSYWIAESDYQLGNWEEAATGFATLQDRCTGQSYDWIPAIWIRLGQIAGRNEQWSEVERIAEDFDAKFPNHESRYKLHYLRGRGLMSQALFNEARVVFQEVIEGDHSRGTQTAAMAQWMIGESYFHQENYHDAVLAYLMVDSQYDYAEWRAIALLQAGKCYQRQNQIASAERIFRQLIQKFPDSPHAATAQALLSTTRQKSQFQNTGFDPTHR